MHLEHLELVNFRSYAAVQLDLRLGVQVLVGPNAQGKTNLVEAIWLLATGASHRVATEAPLVRHGADAAVVRARVQSEGRLRTVEMELRPGGRSRAQVGGVAQPRLRDGVGVVRAVLFAPEDLGLVRGEPGERRRFLDELLGQRRPAYLAARAEYERVLRQRNALLRGARGRGGPDAALLDTWTEQLVHAGAALVTARIAVVHALSGPAAAAHADLVAASPDREASAELTLAYRLSTGRRVPGVADGGVPDPAEIHAELRQGIEERAWEERERGITLAGPQRDDLELELHGMPAKGYASHGETWSIALALRLASREVLAQVGEEPVVLLDDVFAELDERRRGRLAVRCEDFTQVLVTAAVDDDVPLAGPRHRVHAGTISAVTA